MPTTRSLLVLAALTACTGNDAGPKLQYALSLRVPPASEIHRCQLFKAPAEETFVVATSHRYTTGSHHMLLFRTDFTEIPAGMDTPRDCYEDGVDLMAHIRGILHGGQQPTGEVTYPDGVGLALAPNEVLMVQAHYLNTGTAPLDADVSVTLETAPASTVKQRAGTFFFYDPFIYVAGKSSAKANMSCLVRQPVTLLTATSHMHARGSGYAAYLDPPGGTAASPFYTSDSWSHPAGWDGPLDIGANTVIRFECNYENSEDRTFIQGPSAANNEMCMFVGVYYPVMTREDDMCLRGPHEFGAGTTTCRQTLDCIRDCPPGSAPDFEELDNRPDVHECWQKCFAQSCRAAWGPFIDQVGCIQDKCLEACATPGNACTSCVASSCLNEYLACSSSVCD